MRREITFRIDDQWVAFVREQVGLCRALADRGETASAAAWFRSTMQAVLPHVLAANPGREAELRGFFETVTLDSLSFTDPHATG